jgi:hypothetical protein
MMFNPTLSLTLVTSIKSVVGVVEMPATESLVGAASSTEPFWTNSDSSANFRPPLLTLQFFRASLNAPSPAEHPVKVSVAAIAIAKNFFIIPPDWLQA